MASIDGGAGELTERANVSRDTVAMRPQTLEGNLGTLDIVFTVLAYNAPLTVVTGFLPLILWKGNGLGAPLTFLVAGLFMLLFAVGFTTMSKQVPNAGAFYAYITAGLGRPLGLGSAFVAMLSYAMMMVGMFLYAGTVYVQLVKNISHHAPLVWWQWSLLLWITVSILGYLRISLSAKLLTVALVCEVLLVFAWEFSVLAQKGLGALSPGWLTLRAATSGSVGVGILLCGTSFAGFEATAVFREEARSPEVTVPRATYAAIILMSFMFATAAYFLICAYGPEHALAVAAADTSAAAVNSIGIFLGRAGLEAVNALLCSSVFACILALHNILSRYIYSLAVDGTLPRYFAAIHKRYRSPYRASLLVSVIIIGALTVLVLSSVEPYIEYGALTGAGGYALLALQLLTSLAIVRYFWGRWREIGRWKTLYAPLASLAALVATVCLATVNMDLLTGAEKSVVIMPTLIFLILISGALYALRLRRTNPEVYRAIGRQKV